MPRLLPLCLLLACAVPPPASRTLDEVFAQPEGALPFRFAFAGDGRKLAYLKRRPKENLTDLWVYDVGTGRHTVLLQAKGPERLTADERAARERRRDRTRGVSRFWWNPRDDTMLVARSGDLYLLRDGKLEQLTATKPPERNPRWAPDGKALAYVREKNLYVRRDGRETQLTTAGGGAIECGLAEFIAMEELGRHDGFWWSRDSQRIAYAQTDATDVPRFFMHDYLDVRGKPVAQTYPRAGDRNVRWALHVVPAAGGEPVTMKVSGEYLVRVDWMPDGHLAVQVSDRPQRLLTLYRCDPSTGGAEVLLEETDAAWVAFHRDLRLLDDGRFLWTSERSGRRHLYLWGKGRLRQLTRGAWDVAGVVGVNERIFFTGSRESPRERHLYAIALDGRGLEQITTQPGWHGVVADEAATRFLVTHSRGGEPPRITLLAPQGPGATEVELARARKLPDLPRPEFLTIPAADGTPLRAVLYRSARPGPGPAIVHCYGGPGSHLVADRWGGRTYLWHTRLTRLGYTVLTVDNRGAGGYGRAFSRIVSGRLCDWEVKDQAAAARWLGRQPCVDPDRIGIWGWSYGGTLSLMCLLHAPDVFAAGIAVAPVTDWRDYDTAYTERYLGLPEENARGYDLSSPLTAAGTLRRPLLLAHGFMDDNVHFRGAVAFLDRAQKAGRLIEVDFFPRGAHGIGSRKEQLLLFRRMERFWRKHLGR
ncbi:MAG: alpha/beta fold hydrolase [Planctomycetota bacterium]